MRLVPSFTTAIFIFQFSCFAFASQPAAIFFARSSVMVGLVSVAIAAEPQKISPQRRPYIRKLIVMCVPSLFRLSRHLPDGRGFVLRLRYFCMSRNLERL